MKKLMVLVMLLSLLCIGTAQADIFGQKQDDIFHLGPVQKTEKLNITPDDFFTYLGKVISYLGSRAGYGYDFKRKESVTLVGATLFTKWNTALDIGMMNADGVALTVDYNIGTLIPATNSIAKYVKYLYAGVGYGARYDSNNKEWTNGVVGDVYYKFNF